MHFRLFVSFPGRVSEEQYSLSLSFIQGNISIRDPVTNSVVSIVLPDSNICAEVLTSTIIRFTNDNGTKSALNFQDKHLLDLLLQIYRRNGIQYFDRTQESESKLAAIAVRESEESVHGNGDDIQEYFLKTLHTQGFDSISQIEEWLKSHHSKMESNYSSQGKTTEQDEESTYEQDDDTVI
jgi:hypothetical protein